VTGAISDQLFSRLRTSSSACRAGLRREIGGTIIAQAHADLQIITLELVDARQTFAVPADRDLLWRLGRIQREWCPPCRSRPFSMCNFPPLKVIFTPFRSPSWCVSCPAFSPLTTLQEPWILSSVALLPGMHAGRPCPSESIVTAAAQQSFSSRASSCPWLSNEHQRHKVKLAPRPRKSSWVSGGH